MSESAEEAARRFAGIAKALAGKPGVTLGSKSKKGFGSSSLQVDGKIFAMLASSGSFVVKLPRERVDALEASGAGRRFDPGHGRLMKEWLALNAGSEASWLPLAKEALQFVGGKS